MLPSGPGGVHDPTLPRPYIFDFLPTLLYRNGEGGIRTHETLSDLHAFQACAFDRSATSPDDDMRRA